VADVLRGLASGGPLLVEYSPMRLTSARLANFRLFRDTGEVPIDRITVLLAQNENGKTAFLQGLAWFGSDEPLDDEDQWQGAEVARDAEVASLVFERQTEDVEALADAGIKLPKLLRVTKLAGGGFTFQDHESEQPVRSDEEAVALDDFVESREQVLDAISEVEVTTEAKPIQTRTKKSVQSASPWSGAARITAIVEDIRTNLHPHVDPSHHPVIDGRLSTWEASAQERVRTTRDRWAAIRERLPTFIYTDEVVDFVPDRAEYDDIATDPDSHRTIRNLASLAGVDLANVPEDHHRRQRLGRRFAETISDETSRYWKGHPVTFEVTLDEDGVTVSIVSEGRYQKASRRSRGMRWYHGFHINFIAETKRQERNAILLLDEPGLFLHPSAQEGLLDLFDEIAADNIIVYTTHLPFMIPKNHPERMRLLIEDSEGQVRVESKVHARSDADVMKPVRAAIGLTIADTVTLGTNTLICEGMADLYILRAANHFAEESGRTALRKNETILPAGGADKIVPLASFLAGERAKGTVLVDDDTKGRRIETQILRRFANTVPVVRTHNTDRSAAAPELELEDLIEPSYYCDLVNESHAELDGYQPIAVNELRGQGAVADKVQKLFTARGLGDFQKLRPALAFMSRAKSGNAPDDATLDRFSELFTRIRKPSAP
jgi:AAA ATPase-like protein